MTIFSFRDLLHLSSEQNPHLKNRNKVACQLLSMPTE